MKLFIIKKQQKRNKSMEILIKEIKRSTYYILFKYE